MATFTCAACGHSQAAKDELIGKQAACPKCKAANTIAAAPESNPAASIAPVAPPAYVIPAASGFRADSAALNTVAGARGFSMVYWGSITPILIAMAALAYMYFGAPGMISMQGGVPQFAQSLFIVQLLATLVNLLCIGLVILGLVKLGTVTTNTTWGEKRKMALLCYLMPLLAAVLSGLVIPLLVRLNVSVSQDVAILIMQSAGYLNLAAMLCSIIYVFKILGLAGLSGTMLSDDRLIKAATGTRRLFGTFLGLSLAVVLIMVGMNMEIIPDLGSMFFLSFLFLFLFGLVFIIRYFNTLQQAAKAYKTASRSPRR